MRDLKLINFIGIGVHTLTYEDMFNRIDLWLTEIAAFAIATD